MQGHDTVNSLYNDTGPCIHGTDSSTFFYHRKSVTRAKHYFVRLLDLQGTEMYGEYTSEDKEENSFKMWSKPTPQKK